jgi:type IV pilus assembly protein PilB
VTQSTHDVIATLLSEGRLTDQDVADAQQAVAVTGEDLLKHLTDTGKVHRTDALRISVEAMQMQFVELVDLSIDPTALMRVPGEQARRHGVIPIAIRNGTLVVAVNVQQAGNVTLKDDLQRVAGIPVEFAVAMSSDIKAKIDATYRAEGELSALTSDLTADQPEDLELSGVVDGNDDAPVVRWVDMVIKQAITDRASDIHIEPSETKLRVRYRIDGVLHEMSTSPRSMAGAVISRIKIMSDINIAEKRIPQDGRMSVIHNGKKIDLRVATLPTVWGIEKVVMRILDNSTASMSLDDLGFATHNYETFQRSFRKPYGMILVTGPTGSGKSTTLYATLNIVSKPEVNVITVEDPVEYRIPGINQVQVNKQAGLTFAAALRSILRSDPDIVLIGEIRDHETAQIAIEAALTGHLVLSTLHTNDAPSAITRLTEMGIEPFLVGSALDSVLAQRLCRRLCPKCKAAYEPEPEDLMRVGYPWEPGTPLPTLYRPTGCNQCSKTGYRGRIALHEVMDVTEEIERHTVAQSSAADISRSAIANGMKTLRDDGWLKVGQGMTSIEEILRVIA